MVAMNANKLSIGSALAPTVRTAIPGPRCERLRRWLSKMIGTRGSTACRPTEMQLSGGTAMMLRIADLPCTVRCLSGCVWITHDGDPRDYIVRAGQSYTTTVKGDLVMTAFDPSRVALSWS